MKHNFNILFQKFYPQSKMYNLKLWSALSHNTARTFYTSLAVLESRNHYKSLGLESNATQAEIKSAYFKLSMQYHPDKNEGSDEAAQKFRDINEAYEVLGNTKLRKLYDKGVSHISTNWNEKYKPDSTMNFYKSRERRSKPPMTGRTPIYNFDEWSKSHYGATLKKNLVRKEKQQYKKNLETNNTVQVKHSNFLIAFVVSCLTLMYFIPTNEDRVTTNTDSSKKNRRE